VHRPRTWFDNFFRLFERSGEVAARPTCLVSEDAFGEESEARLEGLHDAG